MKLISVLRLVALLLFALVACPRSQAQTFGEWFSQDKTQKKYLIAQIAALQVYLDDLKKGISICQQGLKFIHDVKNGEFNLHSLFFSSLKHVSPEVLRYARVADVLANQGYILSHYKAILSAARSSGQFTANEIDLFTRCFSNLIDEVNTTLDELVAVTTDNQFQMTDDERLNRIELIYQHSSVQRTNLHQMDIDLQQMASGRLKQQLELNAISIQATSP